MMMLVEEAVGVCDDETARWPETLGGVFCSVICTKSLVIASPSSCHVVNEKT